MNRGTILCASATGVLLISSYLFYQRLHGFGSELAAANSGWNAFFVSDVDRTYNEFNGPDAPLFAAMKKEDAVRSIFLMGGDNGYDCGNNFSHWRNMKKGAEDAGATYMATIGNHEFNPWGNVRDVHADCLNEIFNPEAPLTDQSFASTYCETNRSKCYEPQTGVFLKTPNHKTNVATYHWAQGQQARVIDKVLFVLTDCMWTVDRDFGDQGSMIDFIYYAAKLGEEEGAEFMVLISHYYQIVPAIIWENYTAKHGGGRFQCDGEVPHVRNWGEGVSGSDYAAAILQQMQRPITTLALSGHNHGFHIAPDCFQTSMYPLKYGGPILPLCSIEADMFGNQTDFSNSNPVAWNGKTAIMLSTATTQNGIDVFNVNRQTVQAMKQDGITKVLLNLKKNNDQYLGKLQKYETIPSEL